MKTNYYRWIFTLALSCTVFSAQAAIYICDVAGKAVFSEKKQGAHCTLSRMEGSTEVAVEDAVKAIPEKINLKEKPGFAAPEVSDVKILPSRVPSGGVTNTAESVNPRLSIKLRNGKTEIVGNNKSAKIQADELNRKAKIIPAPIIAAPLPKVKPQLTRKQILQNEIRNEQTALVRAKAQLNVAKKKNDQAKMSQLVQAVRDREANIRAIQSEMSR